MKYPCDNSSAYSSENFEPAVGSKVQDSASALSAPSYEGGLAASKTTSKVEASPTPRLVIRGESYDTYDYIDDNSGEFCILVAGGRYPKLIRHPLPKVDGNGSAAIVDFLNCTFHYEFNSPDNFLFELLPILGRNFSPIVNRQKGLYGYIHSFSLGESKAMFAYGGNRSTAFLSFSGESCHLISDWEALVNFLSNRWKAHITRIDLAYDDFEGIHSVDHALEMYNAGLFSSGGRIPRLNQNGNWIKPDGRGRTLYIGSRDNGKLARIYEKGMQLGGFNHPWTRWEVELHNVDREIPWQTVIEPGKFLAGTYPKATGWINETQSRIRTIQNATEISYDHLTKYLSLGYGKFLNVMLAVEGSADKVLEKVIREGIPQRLNVPPIYTPSEGGL